MAFWNREHRHWWAPLRINTVSHDKPGQTVAEVITYRCWGCGSLRYDKVDGDGLVAVMVTDANGHIVKSGE
jgi:hypothetical protein